ncbi:TIGR03752 family integrating conjugative element protein [Photobacterium kishitanii]|uniref:TIGR03752 family integrating conjugative element protein n=1 Tax=Photobacterium kishitanii TaxID=318456 RepID=UPI002738A03E|nr:TIGR03752 family integrating conjugative element protein [Photobacterium kishitanii]
MRQKKYLAVKKIPVTEITERISNDAIKNPELTVTIDSSEILIGEALDTPEEKLRHISGRLNQILLKQEQQDRQLMKLQQENLLLKQQKEAYDTKPKAGQLEMASTELVTQTTNAGSILKEKFNNIKDDIRKVTNQEVVYDSYINEDEQLQVGTQSNFEPKLVDIDNYDSSSSLSTPSDDNEWIQPIDVRIKKGRDGTDIVTYPELLPQPVNDAQKINDKSSNVTKPKPIPYGTIPDGSTLLNTKTMTALIGRVPRKGKIVDPYKFKIKIGKENLASNFQTIPNLDGIIVQGSSSGDRVLKCVRGKVEKLTFTFTDGRTTTVSSKDGSDGGNGDDGLGYLSDGQGVPCISGEYISNDAQYVSSNILLDGFAAAANAFADSEKTKTTSGGDVTESVTGNREKVLFGEMFGASAESGANIVKEFMSDSFAAIYVPNNTLIDVHIEKTIPIDYYPHGRKLTYGGEFNARLNATQRL